MSEHDEQNRPGRVPLGQAPGDTEPEDEPNFAAEHDKTAVAEDIITDTDTDREPESPRGWSGMQR
ncbi:hypothetical protein I0C86_26125 [Plantactinospora sp. S1510]|uniref:Uncharacterized protein n=1 Tax=Plantactinospora alkalitolerans TaxID=2789879 RepID=A0ABS0H1T4_9ACTN|nr:hypothetical protein [Plantactinospora alkalitolerans]MBF9132400.1 hypothetical protein [Plantactinospora alkalitolerans]